MEEGLAQQFYERLERKEKPPGVILNELYLTYYEKPFDAKLIPFFARMVKVYGVNIVYLSLLEMFDIDNVDHTQVFKLIAYLIRRKFANKFTLSETVDFTSELDRYRKEIRAVQKQKLEGVKDPFDDKS